MGEKTNFFAIVFKVSAKFCLHPVIAVNERKKICDSEQEKDLSLLRIYIPQKQN